MPLVELSAQLTEGSSQGSVIGQRALMPLAELARQRLRGLFKSPSSKGGLRTTGQQKPDTRRGLYGQIPSSYSIKIPLPFCGVSTKNSYADNMIKFYVCKELSIDVLYAMYKFYFTNK